MLCTVSSLGQIGISLYGSSQLASTVPSIYFLQRWNLSCITPEKMSKRVQSPWHQYYTEPGNTGQMHVWCCTSAFQPYIGLTLTFYEQVTPHMKVRNKFNSVWFSENERVLLSSVWLLMFSLTGSQQSHIYKNFNFLTGNTFFNWMMRNDEKMTKLEDNYFHFKSIVLD